MFIVLLNIIFSGAWFAAVLFCLMYEFFDTFKKYIDELFSIILKDANFPFATIIMLVDLLACLSWIGVVIEVALIIDYLLWLKNNKDIL